MNADFGFRRLDEGTRFDKCFHCVRTEVISHKETNQATCLQSPTLYSYFAVYKRVTTCMPFHCFIPNVSVFHILEVPGLNSHWIWPAWQVSSCFPLSNKAKVLELITWTKALFKKLIITQLVKKFSASYGNQRFIIMFTRVHNWSLTLARWIQSLSYTQRQGSIIPNIHSSVLNGAF
jgi:hypothetical protein